MEARDAISQSGWYTSYMGDTQGKVLIDCLMIKVKQQAALLETILGEIELVQSPNEESAETILHSIESLIKQEDDIVVSEGSFEWYIKGEQL